jgi:hypothetical protein
MDELGKHVMMMVVVGNGAIMCDRGYLRRVDLVHTAQNLQRGVRLGEYEARVWPM